MVVRKLVILLSAIALLLVGVGAGESLAKEKGGDVPTAIVKVGKNGGTFIVVTGRGRIPPNVRDRSQARLLAKRAAIADGYRRMAETLGMVSSEVVGGRGYVQVDGFIKGAEVGETHYTADDWVSVDVVLDVKLRRRAIPRLKRKGVLVEVVEEGKAKEERRQISREEWMELVRSREEKGGKGDVK